MLVSALVALVVQLVAFAIARILADGGNAIAGWGLGAVICFVVLIVYGFVCRVARPAAERGAAEPRDLLLPD